MPRPTEPTPVGAILTRHLEAFAVDGWLAGRPGHHPTRAMVEAAGVRVGLPSLDELDDEERLALTIARGQLARGESPTPNVAAVCVAALARLVGQPLSERP